MDIVFEKGSEESCRGHALLYFRSTADYEEIWATYLVILPITVDVSKYVPPFLMNQVGDIGPTDMSAFAFPPAPEKVDSYEFIEKIAEARDDDIVFGGTANPTDIPSLLMAVNDIVQRYGDLYSKNSSTLPSAEAAGEIPEGFGVTDVLYGLMSDNDKLSELTKLVGKLRFAADGRETSLMKDAEDDIKLLSHHLPDEHQISLLIDAIKSDDSQGSKLADLRVQRSYCLVNEEYVRLGELEEQIRAFESDSQEAESQSDDSQSTCS